VNLPLIRVLLLSLLLPLNATAASLLSSPRADQLLPGEQAFALLPVERAGKALTLTWNIAPGYYLYRERISVQVLAPAGLKPGALLLPPGIAHHDDHFGEVQIYRGLLQASLPLKTIAHTAVHLRIRFQGCADLGVCYPPQSVEQVVQP